MNRQQKQMKNPENKEWQLHMEPNYNFSGNSFKDFLTEKHTNYYQKILLKNCFIYDIHYIFTGNVYRTVN